MDFDRNRIKLKIAISEIKEENDVVMVNQTKNIVKTIVAAVAGILLSTGVVFAGVKVYENIWKTPEKVTFDTMEITEEAKRENISEEKAKQIAIDQLNKIGFNSKIVKTNHYKEATSNKITYRFITENNYEISINGETGEFYDIWNENLNTQDTNIYITQDEAINIANKYYKLFGYKPGEYEITRVWSNNNEGSGKGDGFKIDITYQKKYGERYNPYESINIVVESKIKDIDLFRVTNLPFDNNDIVITKDKAIQIALTEDSKVTTHKVADTKAELMIIKMNADSYERTSNKDQYYEQRQATDYPMEKRDYYKLEERIRNAWVVVITYEDNYGDDIAKRYTEGSYSYFVDSTTGEIIGGHPMDYIYSNN